MRHRIVIEITVVGMLVVLVLGLFTFTYFNFTKIQKTAWSTTTQRVMDSIQPFQAKFHEQHGRYAVGIFDRTKSIYELDDAIGWKPSITDRNRYIVHIIGKNAYKIVASSPAGDSLCRTYPAEQDCFDLETYHNRGF